MPKCTINGQEIEVKDGTTIIEAFSELKQDIAHYCWHPGLSIAGVCRLCMVEIEGSPKLQIACNTPVKDGMVITNQSDKVEEAVRWGLDFHLINHPLDCPICDQAGECGLQDQYMKYGKYDPEMAERKVKKRKVVDLGERVVLDTERCILCSRCVRFTDEVSQTHELGIFSRGDHSEIGTFKDKPLNNNYSLNTVDICPVGALTSKDFRFRQRVWYLKDQATICTGCSTGCSVKAYYNEEGVFRLTPHHNPEVNGYWMCDKGRETYKHVNRPHRVRQLKVGTQGQWQNQDPIDGLKELQGRLDQIVEEHGPQSVALVLTGQYSNEEYDAVLDLFVQRYGSKEIFHWVNNPDQMDEFDGLLFRGDRNPNTKGLLNRLNDHGIKTTWSDLEKNVKSGQYKLVMVAGPERQDVFPKMNEKIELLSQVGELVWLTACQSDQLDSAMVKTWQVPMKTFVEKTGTYMNFEGREQKAPKITTLLEDSLTMTEVAELLKGNAIREDKRPYEEKHLKTNYFTESKGAL